MKGQKGITLIALIITVIVLLILAGVAISAVSGNGIFQRTQNAVNTYSNSVTNEDEVYNDYANTIDNYMPQQ